MDRARARIDRGAGTSRRIRARGPRSRRPSRRRWPVSAARRDFAATVRCGRGRAVTVAAATPAPLPVGQRLTQAEAQEAVVAGLADAVRAELRPALEIVRATARRAGSRTTGSRRSRGTASGGGPAPAAGRGRDVTARPASTTGRSDVDERVRVEDLGQQLDAVDDPRSGPAEVGRAVEREDLAAADGGQLAVAVRAGRPRPFGLTVSAGGNRRA